MRRLARHGRRHVWLIQLALVSLVIGAILLMIPRVLADRAAHSDAFAFWTNSTDFRGEVVSVPPSEIMLYLNYHDGYSCAYYSDRADLITPEINRVAQFMRAFGAKIAFFTDTVTPTKITVDFSVKDIVDNHMEETSPLFEDKCLFSDPQIPPPQASGDIHRDILYSTQGDFFVDEHSKAVPLAVQLGVKYVIVAGMKCNLWMPALFEQFRTAGLSPIYMYDLSDVAFYREAQKEKLDTHVEALKHFWTWIVGHGYRIVNHFFLLDRHPPRNPITYKFDGNQDAYYFKNYFRRM